MKRFADWINNRPMGAKLLASFLLVIVVTGVLVSGISLYQYLQISQSFSDMMAHQLPIARNAIQVEQKILEALKFEKYYTLTEDSRYKNSTTSMVNQAYMALTEVTRLSQKFNDESLENAASNIWISLESYRQSFTQLTGTLTESKKARQNILTESDTLLKLVYENASAQTQGESIDNQGNALDISLILSNVQQLQALEKDYLLNGNTEAFDGLKLVVKNLADSVSGMSGQQTWVNEVNGSLQAYQTALDNYEQSSAALTDLQGKMQLTTDNIQSQAHEVEAQSWDAMELVQENTLAQMKATQIRILLSLGISLLFGLFLARQLTLSYTRPLKYMAGSAQRIASGDLTQEADDSKAENFLRRKDEIGMMARAFQQMVSYWQGFGTAAGQIAKGNLAIEVDKKSEADALGEAFHLMVTKLQESISEVADNVKKIHSFSSEMTLVASQSDQAAVAIAEKMEQVAQGTADQMTGINQAMEAISLSHLSIARIVSGLEAQTDTVDQGVHISQSLADAVLTAAENIRGAAKESQQATGIAHRGAVTIQETLENMQGIQDQVASLQNKMKVMQEKTDQVSTIVETIEDIASQTNLLAINATIEAAHAESDARTLTESMLERFMLGYCILVARLLELNKGKVPSNYWVDLGHLSMIDQILITDDDGVIRMGNDASLLDWRFPEDNPQTAEFRTLIHQKDGSVCQKAQMRAHDSQVFKYVGVSRRDEPGVVQVGYNMGSLQLFNIQIGGFAVVAREVYRLAESSREATREIRNLLDNIQVAATEASQAMHVSVDSVSAGLEKAQHANAGLSEILDAFQRVTTQTQSVVGTTTKMQELSDQYQSIMQSIQSVVDANNQVTQELARHAEEMSLSVERIANVSEENRDATGAISSSAQVLRQQIKDVSQTATELEDMAQVLSDVVSWFSWKADRRV